MLRAFFLRPACASPRGEKYSLVRAVVHADTQAPGDTTRPYGKATSYS